MANPREILSGSARGERVSAVPRWLAAVMLVVFLGAGGCSAWLLISGDFGGAPTAAEPAAGSPS